MTFVEAPSAISGRRVVPRVDPIEQLPVRLKLHLAVEILAAYVKIRWRMRNADIREVVAWIRAQPSQSGVHLEPGSLQTKRVATRLGIAVCRTLSVLPTDSRCLVQSLVLLWLLSTRAVTSTLVIGAHSRDEFRAHAWVEHFGQPVLTPREFFDSRLLEI